MILKMRTSFSTLIMLDKFRTNKYHKHCVKIEENYGQGRGSYIQRK